MKKTVFSLVAVLILIYVNLALADGNDLLSRCTAALYAIDNPSRSDLQVLSSAGSVGLCFGMMQGVTNLNKVYEERFGKMALFCLPESGINNGQAARIVVKYLKEHPELLHENEVFLVVRAFQEVYPCK